MNNAPVTCRCCGSQQQRFLVGGLDSIYARRTYDVVVCEQCGNGITVPVETQASLDRLYAETYLYPVHECVIAERRYRADGLALRAIDGKFTDANLSDLNIVEATERAGVDVDGFAAMRFELLFEFVDVGLTFCGLFFKSQDLVGAVIN